MRFFRIVLLVTVAAASWIAAVTADTGTIGLTGTPSLIECPDNTSIELRIQAADDQITGHFRSADGTEPPNLVASALAQDLERDRQLKQLTGYSVSSTGSNIYVSAPGSFTVIAEDELGNGGALNPDGQAIGVQFHLAYVGTPRVSRTTPAAGPGMLLLLVLLLGLAGAALLRQRRSGTPLAR